MLLQKRLHSFQYSVEQPMLEHRVVEAHVDLDVGMILRHEWVCAIAVSSERRLNDIAISKDIAKVIGSGLNDRHVALGKSALAWGA